MNGHHDLEASASGQPSLPGRDRLSRPGRVAAALPPLADHEGRPAARDRPEPPDYVRTLDEEPYAFALWNGA
jgi:hypothetical protein